MRVISGRARGTRLRQVPGDTTRPIMDRVKENLFNILGPGYVDQTRWLDLFGGTGQVGIEALSRGAREAVFLDTARAAIKTMHANLQATSLAAQARVVNSDAFAYLKTTAQPFDVIFIAPPQYLGLWVTALEQIDARAAALLVPDGLAVVQIDPKEWTEVALAQLALVDQRTYGNTMLLFYERRDGTPADESSD